MNKINLCDSCGEQYFIRSWGSCKSYCSGMCRPTFMGMLWWELKYIEFKEWRKS